VTTSAQLPAPGSRLRIHVWCQSYACNPGGIQTFTKFVVRGLRDVYPEAKITVFSKNDRWYSFPPNEPATNVVCAGHWPRLIRSAGFALQLVRAARNSRRDVPTILFSTHVNFAPVAGWVKKSIPAARIVAVGHGIEVWKISKAAVRQALVAAADQLIAVSDFTRQRMAAELGIAADRIELLPNTFDADRFQPGPKPPQLLTRYGLTEDQPVVLTVARMAETEQYKGYDNVMLAFPEVLTRFPTARYVLVGDGPDRPRVEALARRLHIAKHVTFAGYVPNEELAGHYNLCDVFAMPSKGEGFGIVFLEALGCGKPVIAGNKDASAEAVLKGKLGVLVDPESEDEIGEAIIRVLEEKAGSKEQGAGEMEDGRWKLGAASKEQGAGKEIGGESDERPTLNAEELRCEVIAAYGYERFNERLREICNKLTD
jgi:glycosyltransferase involved in cell wall biosynthesis